MIEFNEISEKANGGSEIQARLLQVALPSELLEPFQIILSRVRKLDENKVRILWCHDLPGDPESEHLKNGGWRNFHKIVFVSHWQQQAYLQHYNIPWSKTLVLQNAINPVTEIEKDKDVIRFIYPTTPHRGLKLLIPVFAKMAERYDNIHLDVYSSFGVYGWKERDADFAELFAAIDANPKMTNHGAVPNEDVMKAMARSHVFAYPSIWPETSCRALMEAMSAGCLCVHSSFGALPETSANWTHQYAFDENDQNHMAILAAMLESAYEIWTKHPDQIQTRLNGQKSYTDLFYSMELRKIQWMDFLTQHRDLNPKMPTDNGKDVLVFQS